MAVRLIRHLHFQHERAQCSHASMLQELVYPSHRQDLVWCSLLFCHVLKKCNNMFRNLLMHVLKIVPLRTDFKTILKQVWELFSFNRFPLLWKIYYHWKSDLCARAVLGQTVTYTIKEKSIRKQWHFSEKSSTRALFGELIKCVRSVRRSIFRTDVLNKESVPK